MNKDDKYNVIVEENLNNLINNVNAKIKEGWQPSGAVIVSSLSETKPNARIVFYQTMVK